MLTDSNTSQPRGQPAQKCPNCYHSNVVGMAAVRGTGRPQRQRAPEWASGTPCLCGPQGRRTLDRLLPELRGAVLADCLGERLQAPVDRLDGGALRGERGDQFQEPAPEQTLERAERRSERGTGQLLEERLAGLLHGSGRRGLALLQLGPR